MRHTTVGRRAVIVVAAVALFVGASAGGPARASSITFDDVATPDAADPVDEPTPDPAVSSVADLVAAAAARANAGAGPANSAASTVAPDRDAAPVSTPVPILTPDGLLMSYVVNATVQTSAQTPTQITTQTERAAAAVRGSGGVVVQTWPQIGVVIAHSTRATFRADVVNNGGGSVASVGATRSVAVTESTPGPTAPTNTSPDRSTDSSSDRSTDSGTDDVARSGDDAGSSSAADPLRPDAGPRDDTTTVTPPAPAAPPSQPGARQPATDPLEADQWDLNLVKADRAHEITDGSRQVVVGVLDSGIDADHPDLVDNLDVADSVNCTDAGRPDRSTAGWQPTTSDHGTHVAGTIAAERNGQGIVGVAPNARLASVKVVSDDGFVYPEYAVCGFVWAGLRGMDVTNNSYYLDPFQFYCSDQPDQAAAKEAVRRAVTWSTSRGVVHAAAAGNSAYDLADKTTDATSPDDSAPVVRTINDGCQDIPTELPGVVTVSSLAQIGNTLDSALSSFSNRGLGKVDVAAPGSNILSTIVSNNGYGRKSGTSMATPHVAGVLALMKGRHPTWKPDRLIAQLLADADPKACPPSTPLAPCVGTPADNSYFGHGVVDALDAVR